MGVYTVNASIKPTFTLAIMKKNCIFFLSFILHLKWISQYRKSYISILLTVCNNVSMKNVIKLKLSIDWHWRSIASSPFRILIVLTNHLIWFTSVTMFLTDRKKQTRSKIDETTFAEIDLLYFSSFIYKKKKKKKITVSLRKTNLQKKLL